MEPGIPFIDPDVLYVSVGHLRALKAADVCELHKTLVVQHGGVPRAVLLPYEGFLVMQAQLHETAKSVWDMFKDESIREGK